MIFLHSFKKSVQKTTVIIVTTVVLFISPYYSFGKSIEVYIYLQSGDCNKCTDLPNQLLSTLNKNNIVSVQLVSDNVRVFKYQLEEKFNIQKEDLKKAPKKVQKIANNFLKSSLIIFKDDSLLYYEQLPLAVLEEPKWLKIIFKNGDINLNIHEKISFKNNNFAPFIHSKTIVFEKYLMFNSLLSKKLYIYDKNGTKIDLPFDSWSKKTNSQLSFKNLEFNSYRLSNGKLYLMFSVENKSEDSAFVITKLYENLNLEEFWIIPSALDYKNEQYGLFFSQLHDFSVCNSFFYFSAYNYKLLNFDSLNMNWSKKLFFKTSINKDSFFKNISAHGQLPQSKLDNGKGYFNLLKVYDSHHNNSMILSDEEKVYFEDTTIYHSNIQSDYLTVGYRLYGTNDILQLKTKQVFDGSPYHLIGPNGFKLNIKKKPNQHIQLIENNYLVETYYRYLLKKVYVKTYKINF